MEMEMTEIESDKWTLIEKIIATEQEMFLKVNAREHSACQEQPGTFKLMRWMSHSVLSRTTLASYLEDLDSAHEEERNLMTEKYARMENLIPPLQNNPLIDEIAAVELQWMQAFSKKYPHIIRDNPADFERYLRCEYETYSGNTLHLLYKDIQTALSRKLNLVELRYKNLFKRMGYSSLDEVGSPSN